MAGIRDFVANPAAAWRSMSQGQRVAAMIGVAAFVTALIVSLNWVNTPTYRPLFTGLSNADGGAVVNALSKMNVPYQVKGGGSIIEVPSTQVDQVRLKLATQGLPHGGNVGFGVLNKEPLGTSEFVEHVNYQRALAGTLAQTIQSLSVVQSASVHLALPPPTVFLNQQQKPTASVMVKLYAGRSLSPDQVAGIQHLVAAAVPNLDDSKVAVVDSNGHLLSAPQNAQLNLAPSQLQFKAAVQSKLAQQIRNLLTPVVGPHGVRVEVSADIDFSKGETASIKYGKSHILSQQLERSIGSTSLSGFGIPGAVSNTPPGSASAPITQRKAAKKPAKGASASTTSAAAGATGAVPQHTSQTVNYDVDRTISHKTVPAGTIDRLSIAVLLNEHTVKGPKGKPVRKPFSASEIKQIKQMVQDAVGFNAGRGDSISVISMPFTSAPVQNSAKIPWWQAPWVPQAMKYGVGALIFLLAWLLFVRPLMKAALNRINASSATRIATTPAGQPPEIDDPPDDPPPAQTRAQRSTSEARVRDQLARAHEVVDNDPRGAASVVREWLTDGK